MSIDVQSISRSFGDTQALADASFKVKEGEVTAFVGPNGAGTVSYTHLTLPTTPYV